VHRVNEVANLRYGTATDQVRAYLWRVVIEHADGATPELTAHVDIRAELEQHVDHRAIVPAEDDRGCGGLEIRPVDFAAQFRMRLEQSADALSISLMNRALEFFHSPNLSHQSGQIGAGTPAASSFKFNRVSRTATWLESRSR